MRKRFIFALLMVSTINLIAAQDQPQAASNVAADPQVVSILKGMATLHSQIDSAQTLQAKAEAWLNLNRQADVLAKRMTQLLPTTPGSGPPTPTPTLNQIADQSKVMGIVVNYCEIGTDWAADSAGYVNYLNLWPDGPNADEAFWKSKVEANACGDFEGTAEEYEQGIKMYGDFIKRFPASSFTARAKSQLEGYQAGLHELQDQQAKPAPANSHN